MLHPINNHFFHSNYMIQLWIPVSNSDLQSKNKVQWTGDMTPAIHGGDGDSSPPIILLDQSSSQLP